MQLVMMSLATMALSVCRRAQATTTQMARSASSATSCVWEDAPGQGISLAKEDAMRVLLSTSIRMTHRCVCCACVRACVRACVCQCVCVSVCVCVCWWRMSEVLRS